MPNLGRIMGLRLTASMHTERRLRARRAEGLRLVSGPAVASFDPAIGPQPKSRKTWP
jgi:hypothetical protein